LRINQQFMKEIRPMSGILMVRLGDGFDGGYVLPKSAINICDSLISLGYGYESSFERHFLKLNKNKSVALYDLDINLISSVGKLFEDFKLMVRNYRPVHYKRLFDLLWVLLNPRIEYRNGRIGHINDADCLNLIDVFKSDAGQKVILKMDIEGSEYESLSLDLNILDKCQLLIVEFHDIESRIEEFLAIIKRIRKKFTLVNTHINNNGPVIKGIPSVIELCFMRSSMLTEEILTPAKSIPHSDDRPCNPSKAEFVYRY